jgi:hypothetical protein
LAACGQTLDNKRHVHISFIISRFVWFRCVISFPASEAEITDGWGFFLLCLHIHTICNCSTNKDIYKHNKSYRWCEALHISTTRECTWYHTVVNFGACRSVGKFKVNVSKTTLALNIMALNYFVLMPHYNASASISATHRLHIINQRQKYTLQSYATLDSQSQFP